MSDDADAGHRAFHGALPGGALLRPIMDLLDEDLDAINLELEDDAPSSRHGRIKVRSTQTPLLSPPPRAAIERHEQEELKRIDISI